MCARPCLHTQDMRRGRAGLSTPWEHYDAPRHSRRITYARLTVSPLSRHASRQRWCTHQHSSYTTYGSAA
ncbi:hypothetical protein NDU88_006471 [Pleurodeles waltl]|uniref:Uncharacterized protein n=1 Tax=Pleurodeles waltl TaxID=8319 RepID=A0AAV7WFR7_PLEWA|nr:hypothetical protein NDU88_006471 [Pleurodeles waltl]